MEEVGLGATSSGRAPRLISLAKNQPKALGFELTETSILASLYDSRRSLCAQCRLPFADFSPDRVVEKLHNMRSSLLKDVGSEWSKLEGVGIAVPGDLDGSSGRVRWCNCYGWKNVPFKELCEDRWNVDTDVVNDALAGGMAAQYFHQDKSTKNLVFLFFRFDDRTHEEVGVGAGIIVDGRPYHGEFGAAGQIRMPFISPLVYARELGEEEMSQDIAAFVTALEQGHPVAKKAIAQVGESAFILVQQAITFLEPGKLVIDSDEPLLRDTLTAYLQTALCKNQPKNKTEQTRLVASDLGEFGVSRERSCPLYNESFEHLFGIDLPGYRTVRRPTWTASALGRKVWPSKTSLRLGAHHGEACQYAGYADIIQFSSDESGAWR